MAFGDILKNQDSGGKEKHVPTIETSKDKGADGADICTPYHTEDPCASHIKLNWF